MPRTGGATGPYFYELQMGLANCLKAQFPLNENCGRAMNDDRRPWRRRQFLRFVGNFSPSAFLAAVLAKRGSALHNRMSDELAFS